MNAFRAAFQYMNVAEAQQALADTYKSIQNPADKLTMQLQAMGGHYDVRSGVYIWMKAQLAYMSTNGLNFWLTGKGMKYFAAERVYWQSQLRGALMDSQK